MSNGAGPVPQRRASDGIEGVISATVARVDHLDAAVAALADTLRSGLNAINDRLDAMSRPQYGLLLQLLALIVTVGVLVLVPLKNQTHDNTEQRRALYDGFVDHVRDGHPRRVEEKIAAHAERFERNETEIVRLRDWRAVYDRDVVPLVARQAAELDALRDGLAVRYASGIERIERAERRLEKLTEALGEIQRTRFTRADYYELEGRRE